MWYKGLSPFVTDPDSRLLHIPEKWDGTLVVRGCGIAYKNNATGTTELECLSISRCATVKAVRVWLDAA
jgi:hypothetical protein